MAEFLSLGGGASVLSHYFGWAGDLKGDTDIVISAPTTWNDEVGFKKAKKLTINANQVLTIARSPFFIFADEIVFGNGASKINGDGPSGSSEGVFPDTYARGGTAISGDGRSQGGCGGIMLFVIANKISGSNGVISANGGNGYNNGVAGNTATARGGQGALSITLPTGNSAAPENFSSFIRGLYPSGAIANYDNMVKNRLESILGEGGGAKPANSGGKAGGSGGINTSIPKGGGGGSGIGGGAGTASDDHGLLPIVTPKIKDLIYLADLNCLGGGGGGARTFAASSLSDAIGAGGGGGSVVCWAKEYDAIPVLQADGGIGQGVSYTANGAKGVTYLIKTTA